MSDSASSRGVDDERGVRWLLDAAARLVPGEAPAVKTPPWVMAPAAADTAQVMLSVRTLLNASRTCAEKLVTTEGARVAEAGVTVTVATGPG